MPIWVMEKLIGAGLIFAGAVLSVIGSKGENDERREQIEEQNRMLIDSIDNE